MKSVVLMDNRLRQVLINDRKDNPGKIIGLIKSELFFVLRNYMDVKIDDLQLDIGIDNNGKYLINFNCEVSRIYIVNHLI